jgi:DNA-binding NarL/FixJ family response regulator
VRRLDECDVSALLAFASELRALDDPLPFPPRVLAGLQSLIPSDSVSYSELDPSRRISVLQAGRIEDGDEVVVWGVSDDWKASHDLFWKLRNTHPLCHYRTLSGDWTTARKVSDFAPLRTFRRTAIYDAFYRGELDYWFDVGLRPEPDRTRVFIFTRYGGADFGERDRLVGRLVQPHLQARADEVERVANVAAQLAEIEGGSTDETHRVVLCTPSGRIEFASSSSRALLRRYLGLDNGQVTPEVLETPNLVVADGDRRLTIRSTGTGSVRLLFLEEHDTRIDRLTSREREVLDRVARGLENDAISFELGIATATVAKHLEHVYEKLGVHNRTAAAALIGSRPR